MKKISKKQMEQMDNMIKNIWTPPTNNKKESRKLTKYKNKKYETQTVLIRLTNSNKIPSSVMDYAVNDKDIIIDTEQNLALVEVRLTHQQYPAIPKHVKKYMVEQVELKDKEAIKKEFKGINYLDDKLDKPFKYSSDIDIKPEEPIMEELTIEKVAEELIEETIEELVVPNHVKDYIHTVKTTAPYVEPRPVEPLAKSDKIIIPIISFSVWRLAIKFTIEFKR